MILNICKIIFFNFCAIVTLNFRDKIECNYKWANLIYNEKFLHNAKREGACKGTATPRS